MKGKNPEHTFKHMVSFAERTKGNLPAHPPLRGRTRQPLKMYLFLVGSTNHLQELRVLKMLWIFFVACSKVTKYISCLNFAAKLTPVPKLPVLLSSDSPASGGKRKRKIQLVSSHGENQISLVRTSNALHSQTSFVVIDRLASNWT